nr:CuZn superoxide dismutase 2 [Flammulina velutipes]
MRLSFAPFLRTTMNQILTLILAFLSVSAHALPIFDQWFGHPRKAVVYVSGPSSVNGTIIFEQTSAFHSLRISVDIIGLDANASRGIHVHEFGNLTAGCASAGGHFNPYNKTHGAPTDSKSSRHVGDLGNLQTDAEGNAKFTTKDKLMSLWGETDILGRALVIHAGTDDLGKGGVPDSLTTGNAGARSACGVIGRV